MSKMSLEIAFSIFWANFNAKWRPFGWNNKFATLVTLSELFPEINKSFTMRHERGKLVVQSGWRHFLQTFFDFFKKSWNFQFFETKNHQISEIWKCWFFSRNFEILKILKIKSTVWSFATAPRLSQLVISYKKVLGKRVSEGFALYDPYGRHPCRWIHPRCRRWIVSSWSTRTVTWWWSINPLHKHKSATWRVLGELEDDRPDSTAHLPRSCFKQSSCLFIKK